MNILQIREKARKRGGLDKKAWDPERLMLRKLSRDRTNLIQATADSRHGLAIELCALGNRLGTRNIPALTSRKNQP